MPDSRRVARGDVLREVSGRIAARSMPGQRLYFAEAAAETHARIVVDNNDPTSPFLAQRQ